MDYNFLTTFYIIAMEIFLALTIVKVLKKSDMQNPSTVKAGLIFGLWLLLSVILFGFVKILPENITSMTLFSTILLGVTLSGLLFYLLKEELLNLSQELLLLPQAFRMFFGAGFIVEAVFQIMPINYGVIDGILHITTAFLSTTLAIYIARGCSCFKSLLLVNLFGLLDILIVAGGISFVILEEIGSEHNVFLAVFFAAPIFIWLHIFSLIKLYRTKYSHKEEHVIN